MVFYRKDMKETMMGRFGPEECLGLACILERSGAPPGLGTRRGVMRACSRSPRVEWKGRRGIRTSRLWQHGGCECREELSPGDSEASGRPRGRQGRSDGKEATGDRDDPGGRQECGAKT